MTIFTPLISQTKKEINQIVQYRDIRDGECDFKSIVKKCNSDIGVLKERLKNFQLAEKMHLDFVEKLKEMINKKWGYLDSIKGDEELIEEINRLSEDYRPLQNLSGEKITPRSVRETQKGEEKWK